MARWQSIRCLSVATDEPDFVGREDLRSARSNASHNFQRLLLQGAFPVRHDLVESQSSARYSGGAGDLLPRGWVCPPTF